MTFFAGKILYPHEKSLEYRKTLTSGLGLDDMFGLARRDSTIGFHLL